MIDDSIWCYHKLKQVFYIMDSSSQLVCKCICYSQIAMWDVLFAFILFFFFSAICFGYLRWIFFFLVKIFLQREISLVEFFPYGKGCFFFKMSILEVHNRTGHAPLLISSPHTLHFMYYLTRSP